MKIHQQVANLELSQKLKSLGLAQSSAFYWIEEPFEEGNRWRVIFYERLQGYLDNLSTASSAFTASELLELLPANINNFGLSFDVTSILTEKGIKSLFHLIYKDYDKEMFDEFADLNVCNALAKMIIHLIEQEIIEV